MGSLALRDHGQASGGATLSSKEQVVIPANVRERLGLFRDPVRRFQFGLHGRIER